MKKSVLFIAALFITGLMSCSAPSIDDQQSQANKPDTKEAVNVSISTAHNGSVDILTISALAYDKDGNLIKRVLRRDTLPSLGSVRDTLDTGKTTDDDDETEIDTIVNHPKDYKVYITVK